MPISYNEHERAFRLDLRVYLLYTAFAGMDAICRARDIKSTIKYANQGCTRRAKNSQYVAENILNRQFHADKPNEK